VELSSSYREEFERVMAEQAAADACRAEAARAVRDALQQSQGLPRELCDALDRLGLALTTITYEPTVHEDEAEGG
jgi:hypothetical protein